jgi:ribosomal protein S18 acetylase RimI-like enzyme
MDRDNEHDNETAGSMSPPYPHYRCPVDGEALPLSEARITVTCRKHSPAATDTAFEIRQATDADRRDIEELCDRAWGETEVDAFGAAFDVLRNDNVLAIVDGALAGMVSLAVHGGELAVVLLSVYPEHQGAGIGKALLDAAEERAFARRLPFVKTVVSNDDISALYFYQRNGFVITDVALGALADRHGSAVPGFAGMPMRDEIRLRRPIAPA